MVELRSEFPALPVGELSKLAGLPANQKFQVASRLRACVVANRAHRAGAELLVAWCPKESTHEPTNFIAVHTVQESNPNITRKPNANIVRPKSLTERLRVFGGLGSSTLNAGNPVTLGIVAGT